MSELKTNKIATNDTNNVAMDNSLNLKSYTTSQRDALTSTAGDVIYNSTLGNPQVYDGSSWNDLKAGVEGFQVEYLVVGGGGAVGIHCESDFIETTSGVDLDVAPDFFDELSGFYDQVPISKIDQYFSPNAGLD